MNRDVFKDELYAALALVGKAIGSARRIELLDLVSQAERPVEWLARATGMTVANTSQHLQLLRSARLVEVRREGIYAYYRLASPAVSALCAAVRAVAEERDAEVVRLLRACRSDEIAAVSLEELAERLSAGDVAAIDVRPREEFEAAHIAGARSFPLDQLPELTGRLPRDRLIVAYCRGPYCLFADDAARLLVAAGFDAARLEGGLPEWRAAGLPIRSAA